MGPFCPARSLRALVAVLVLAAPPVAAQLKSPRERLDDLEKDLEKLKNENEELEKRIRDLEEGKGAPGAKADETKPFFADGIFTLGGGVELKIGGKAEFLLIDSQSESDPIVGSTDEPDPHFAIDVFRLAPVLKFNREISMHAQLDFHVDRGRDLLKELTVRHQVDPAWWLRSDARLGLDDRFIRVRRDTENYPLVGNAFWRDESLAFFYMLRFGDKAGPPPEAEPAGARAAPADGSQPAAGKKKKKAAKDGAAAEGEPAPAPAAKEKKKKKEAKDGAAAEGEPAPEEESGTEEPPAGEEPPAAAEDEAEGGGGAVLAQAGAAGEEPAAAASAHGPFDFGWNPGELQLHFSIGSGYNLDTNEVGFDRAGFNDIVQDDRNVTDDLSIREVGVGLGYARNFEWLGELSVLGFYYDDELTTTSVDFLQQELTLRDLAGNVLAGYGDSDSRESMRYGIGGEYFFPASTLFGEALRTRRNDGLRLHGQWIRGQDGELRRDGWYAQASYRFSFPVRLFDRYFRSIEPVVRYSRLDTDIDPVPQLAGTWDREEVLVGMIVEVTNEVFFKVEYTFHDEDTGAGGGVTGPKDVDNNELMFQVLLQF